MVQANTCTVSSKWPGHQFLGPARLSYCFPMDLIRNSVLVPSAVVLTYIKKTLVCLSKDRVGQGWDTKVVILHLVEYMGFEIRQR